MPGPALAIIVPNYNGAPFIGDTVERLARGFPDALLLVVDDASTDDSVAQLAGSCAVVLRRPRNGGFAAAVNSGLRHCRAAGVRHVVVANSDLEITDDQSAAVQRALQQFGADTAVGVIGFVEDEVTGEAFPEGSNISGFLFAMRIEVVERVGEMDERFFMYGEEQDYFRRVEAAGFSIVQTGIRVGHRSEGSSGPGLRNAWLAIRNSIFLEVKSRRPAAVLRKIAVLAFLINRIRRPGREGDPSMRRLLRPGVLLGNVFLVAAIGWNAGRFLSLIVSGHESESQG
jgi:GT2 family glycosyltransferase